MIPQSQEAENGLIGCFLTDPSCVDGAQEAGFAPAWHFDCRNRVISQTVLEMRQMGIQVDCISLGQTLKDSGRLEEVGGLAHLSDCLGSCPSVHVMAYFLGILREKFRLRTLMQLAVDLQTEVQALPVNSDASALIDSAESRILAIRSEFSTSNDKTAKQVMREWVDAFQAKLAGESDAIPTGLWNLDSRLKGGVRPGRVYVIAARPGAGKTALAITAATSIALSGVPVGVFSLEMATDELAGRLAAQESGVDVSSMDTHRHPDSVEYQRITSAVGRTAALPMVFDDRADQTIASIRAVARRWVRDGKARVLVIDYLTLIQGAHGDRSSRREIVDAMSRGVKQMAKELGVPVILLAQLNREIEKGGGRKPKLSDLRESGAIEQDADFVGMLWMDAQNEELAEADPRKPRTVMLQVTKNRGGAGAGAIKFTFHPTLTKFEPANFTKPE